MSEAKETMQKLMVNKMNIADVALLKEKSLHPFKFNDTGNKEDEYEAYFTDDLNIWGNVYEGPLQQNIKASFILKTEVWP